LHRVAAPLEDGLAGEHVREVLRACEKRFGDERVKDDLRDLMERLMSQPTDTRFSCHDWMEESRLHARAAAYDVAVVIRDNAAALDYLKKHPVPA
jgi:hypothetical protein